MRIAISGTHFMGKSTLIDNFIEAHPEYKSEVEENLAYRKEVDKYFKKIYRDDDDTPAAENATGLRPSVQYRCRESYAPRCNIHNFIRAY